MRDAIRGGEKFRVREHGGHRYGTGWGKSEFNAGWAEPQVRAFVAALLDDPAEIMAQPFGFKVRGSYQGVLGEVVVNHDGTGSGWHVVTAYPIGVP